MVTIDPIPVVIGTVGYQLLGTVWYGPVFGSIWMDAMGYDNADDMGGENATLGYTLTAAGSLVAVISLAVLIAWAGATSWEFGLGIGALVGIGFVATTGLQTVPFEDRPWMVYLLSTGYNAIALAGIGVLLAVW